MTPGFSNRGALARALCFVMALALLACAGRSTRTEKPPEELYLLAQQAVEDSDWEDAGAMIDQLRDEFPFSRYAVDAELLTADMAFKRKNYEEAAAAYRSFEELHPTHAKVPYAIYQRGLAYLRLSLPPDRDQTATRTAADALQKLLFAHPKSDHAADARAKLGEIRERLAAHEFYVARYYSRKGKHDAALGRLQRLVQNYPESDLRDRALQQALELVAETKAETGSN